jgi:hypothetical protein
MTHTREQINQLKQWNVEITFLDRGCLVRVGCKSFAFESVERAMAKLTEYTKDPIGVGELYAPEQFQKGISELQPRELQPCELRPCEPICEAHRL